MENNSTLDHQLNHRSIRFFKDQAVEGEKLSTIFSVAQRTATSTGMQAVSIIRLTDQAVKNEIMEVAGQAYIAEAPELCLFIIDHYRNMQIAQEMGSEVNQPTMNHFFQGIADAHLMAQNMMNAIESIGLGGCFLGNVLNDPAHIIQALKLPSFTFPILGMIFGYPDDNPQLKPRLSMDMRLFENSYETFDSYLDKISDYDQEMTTYYDTRFKNKRSDSFSRQVKASMETVKVNRDQILKVIEDQGFDLGLVE